MMLSNVGYAQQEGPLHFLRHHLPQTIIDGRVERNNGPDWPIKRYIGCSYAIMKRLAVDRGK